MPRHGLDGTITSSHRIGVCQVAPKRIKNDEIKETEKEIMKRRKKGRKKRSRKG